MIFKITDTEKVENLFGKRVQTKFYYYGTAK